MVRINLIKPQFLSDQHLLAEHNEIQMLITWKNKHSVSKDSDPTHFTLNKGHMSFFRNKGLYLALRLLSLNNECKKRGFKGNIRVNLLSLIFGKSKIYSPKSEDLIVIKERILNRLNQKPEWYRYYGESKSSKFWNDMIEKATT